jgi:hypothetical protein
MGYKRKAREYRLRFEGDEYDGFECTMGSLSVDEFLEMSSLAMGMQSLDSKPADINRLFDLTAEKIISWNLEDDEGKPVLADPEHLRAQDFPFVMTIQTSWMNAMAQVPGPLLNALNNGGTTPEDIATRLASLSQSR